MAKTTSKLTNALWVLFAVCAILGALLHVGSLASIAAWLVALMAAAGLVVISRRSAKAAD